MKKNIIFLLTIVLVLFVSVTFAGSGGGGGGGINWPTIGNNDGGLEGPVESVLGAIQFIGAAFAVGMLIVLGVKYVMASAQEKADLKKGMLSYVIGAILIGAASSLPALIAGMVKF
jgi:hypothetical protein